jgi:hypothetical protein
MSGRELDPHVSGTGNLWIRVFWGLELEPTNDEPGTTVSAFIERSSVVGALKEKFGGMKVIEMPRTTAGWT